MRVEWLESRGRSGLWDRREQSKRIRMGAQARGRAREALRPCELFASDSLRNFKQDLFLPPALYVGLPTAVFRKTVPLATCECAQSSRTGGHAAMPSERYMRGPRATS